MLEGWKISPEFSPKGHAPETPYKCEMALAAESPLKAAIRDCLSDKEDPKLRSDLIVFRALLEKIHLTPGFERTPAQVVTNALIEMSFVRLGEFRLKGDRIYLWAARGSPFASDPFLAKDKLRKRLDQAIERGRLAEGADLL